MSHRKGYIPDDPSPICLECGDPWPCEGDLWECAGCGVTAPEGSHYWRFTDAAWCPKCGWLA